MVCVISDKCLLNDLITLTIGGNQGKHSEYQKYLQFHNEYKYYYITVYCRKLIIVNNHKVEMDSSNLKSILDPYKTIGCFVHGPVACSKTQPFSIAVTCYNSFKIYSQQLTIKMVWGNIKQPIRAIHIHNQYCYILTGAQIIKVKYHHIVKKWKLPNLAASSLKIKNKQNASMLVFDGLLIIGVGLNIYMLIEDQSQDSNIQAMALGLNILQIVHPVTYINKIIVYSQDRILLVNPIAQKILFDYNTVVNEMLQGGKKICIVRPSPLVDIVAVCLDSGQIVILNIRTSKIIFTMKQKRPVTAISFSETDSMMASADQSGNIILWDLENKKIIYRLESAFQNSIDSLFFVPGLPLLTATSSKANAIKQFRINLDDTKTLLQFRQRAGCPSSSPIIGFKCQNNKQITFSTKSNTVFSSLYSHSNMYNLPLCLDSALPYHVIAKNFTIELYRERTNIGKLNIHENCQIAKFSLSKKFIIIGTKSRIMKIAVPSGSKPSTVLHQALQWKVNEPLDIITHCEHFIYVLCFDNIYVFKFNEATLVGTINEGDNCYNLVSNYNQNMLALENRTKETIEIWDMRNLTLSRSFSKNKDKLNCTKLCFTTDNKYLLSAHLDHKILIWSILQSDLYKIVQLESQIVDMSFTPDNAYFLSIFQNGKQINIWHNYIGKITSSQKQIESFKFQTSFNYLAPDYRSKLNQEKDQLFENQNTDDQQSLDNLLDQVEDEQNQNVKNYDFTSVSKWMPLVYYDEIKNRNSISNQQIPSLPFFLDFKNLSEQQAKINNQMKEELRDKKNKQKQKIDAHLSNDLHQIRLTDSSDVREFEQTWEMISKLSVAEADYQLRRYLILPGNCQNILKMFVVILEQNKVKNLLPLNVVLIRTLEIVGSEICSQTLKQIGQSLLQKIQDSMRSQEEIVQRCIAVASQNN